MDSALKELSTDTLSVQISLAELLLTSFLFVLSFSYGETLGGHGFVMVCLRLRYKHCWIELAESYLNSDT